jgi:16S rRNA (cytosine967-C5)-methyltransferase
MIIDWNNARNIAVNCLLLFEQKAQGIQETLDRCFGEQTLEFRERALASELAYGSCRHLITLDTLIKRYSTRRFQKIDKLILQILRVGLYQMLFLDRTPDFAAVHKAVQQAKAYGPKGGGSFVNAILRQIQREIKGSVTTDTQIRVRATLWRDDLCGIEFEREFLPDPNKQKTRYYSSAYSHPVWLIERWIKRYDEATLRSILLADNARPRLSLRVNRLRCKPDKLAQSLREAGYKHEIWGEAIVLQQSAPPEQLPGYEEGCFFVQDLAAMSVGPKTAVKAGDRVLDLCAAPGGKCTHLAELMTNQGEVIACDVSRSKRDLVEANCRRLGISIVRTCLPDELETIHAQSGPFDAVLVDAPCSNTGVLARRVEVRHRLKPVDLQALKSLQLKLLRQGAKLVRKGGRLIYSTCSIESGENEELVQKFLRENHTFEILDQHLHLPGQAAKEMPLIHTDGGYVAILRKYIKPD